jgi:hypothetical protein
MKPAESVSAFDSLLTDEERVQDAWVTLASLLLQDEKADLKEQLRALVVRFCTEVTSGESEEFSTSGVYSDDTLSEVLNCGMCSDSSLDWPTCSTLDVSVDPTASTSGYLASMSDCTAPSIESDVSLMSKDVYNGSVSTTDCSSSFYQSWCTITDATLPDSSRTSSCFEPSTTVDVSIEARVGSAMSTFEHPRPCPVGGTSDFAPCGVEDYDMCSAPTRQWHPRKKQALASKVKTFFKNFKRVC